MPTVEYSAEREMEMSQSQGAKEKNDTAERDTVPMSFRVKRSVYEAFVGRCRQAGVQQAWVLRTLLEQFTASEERLSIEV